jgi:hypothetical protein
VWALRVSRKKLRIPDAPNGIRHFAEMMSVGLLQDFDEVRRKSRYDRNGAMKQEILME